VHIGLEDQWVIVYFREINACHLPLLVTVLVNRLAYLYEGATPKFSQPGC